MNLEGIAAALGRGLLAGVAGTAAMTVSSTLEARLRGRGSSTTPADAVGRALHVEPSDEVGQQRLNTAAHWGYGVAWGTARGLLALAGLRGLPASLAHFGVVWGAEQAVLPGLGVSTPAWRWPAREVAIDVLHHAVYALATGAAYDRSGG